MNQRSALRSSFLVGTVALFMGLPLASAAPLLVKDSQDFDYRYEMDALLGTMDLDANTAADWFNATASGVTQPTVAGGFGNSNQTAVPQQILWRTDFTNSLSRVTVNRAFTIEFSLQLLGGTGTTGVFGATLQQPSQGQSLRLNIAESAVNFNNLGVNPIATASNSDAQHVFRIAYENNGTNGGTDDEYWIWRDGVLLNPGGVAIAGSNAGFNNGGAWFLGDSSGTLAGEWKADYIRVTPGAFSPIPEPASLLLVCGALIGACVVRRVA